MCGCRHYPQLKSIILDLPEAVGCAAPLLASENIGECIMHRPGNPRTDDLGEISVDIVFLSQFVHHFSGRQNRAAMSRIAHRYVPAASA